jgi:hypothetical protein
MTDKDDDKQFDMAALLIGVAIISIAIVMAFVFP